MDNLIIMLYWGGNMCIGQDGHETTDWSHRRRDYIELWDHRLQYVVLGIRDAAQMLDSDPYII